MRHGARIEVREYENINVIGRPEGITLELRRELEDNIKIDLIQNMKVWTALI
jgi:hypothetical protein